MLTLFALIALVKGSCDWGVYDDPNNPGSCLPCNVACGDCTGPDAYQCTQCSSDYSLINGICMRYCPLGFQATGNVCEDKTTDSIAYNIDFTRISNTVKDKAAVLGNVIPISAGSTSNYYPVYDTNDPYAVSARGFYLNGNAYFKNDDSNPTFGPVFTIAMWLKPTEGTSYVFTKQTTSSYYMSISMNGYVPVVKMYISSQQAFTSSNALTASSWNFLMVKATLDDYKSKVSVTVNTATSTSSTYTTYFADVFSSFYCTVGAQYTSSTYNSFYTGYIWSLKLGNKDLPSSTFMQSSGCSGCSICPAENSNECISDCNYKQYINSGSCVDCTSGCQTYGCVRNDIKCNLCYDQKCSYCSTFFAGCTLCVSHAYLLSDSSCICDYNYIWDTELEECRPCSEKCSTCDGGGYLGCSSCKDGFYMHWGLCLGSCPTGYQVSGSSCVLISTKRIMNMKFNKIEPIVYDTMYGIPAVTGSSSKFYPDYDIDDPIPAIERGYYFGGSALMHYAPYSTWTSPYLTFSPVCYIALWIAPATANGIIYSSMSSSMSYSIIVQIELANSFPKITLALSLSSSSTDQTYPSYTSTQAISLNSWSYVVFSISLDSHERTYMDCYINKVAQSSTLMGQGHFTDITQENVMIMGTAQTGSSTLSTNYYQGYVYQIIVDVDLENPNTDIGSACDNGCTSCLLDGTCLNTCDISEYPSGDLPNECTNCHDNCLTVGCVDDDETCNLCGDKSCEVCTSYDVADCTTYKCDPGTYKVVGMADCQACDTSCAECNNAGPSSCTSCTGDLYLLENTCHTFCPTGYNAGVNSCALSTSPVIDLNLLEIHGSVPDTESGYEIFAGCTNLFYPTFDSCDPWPLKNRGYYFSGASYLEFPPNSVDLGTFTFGNQFTISAWIKSESNGSILEKMSNDYINYILLSISNNKLQINLKLTGQSSVTSTNSFTSSTWTFIAVSIKLESDSITSAIFYINTKTETKDVGSGSFTDLKVDYFMTIGASKSSSDYTNYWTGALYMLKIYPLALVPDDYSTTCSNSEFSCSICPKTTLECLDTCDQNHWWNGASCKDCKECSYDSCVRSDNSCNLCYDVRCFKCTTFSSGSCTECKQHASLSLGVCTCDTNYLWDSIQEACVYCDPAVKASLQGLCLDECPTGYTNNDGVCTGSAGKVFEINLDKKIRGTITDSVGGLIEVTTGISSEYYPYYDLGDPYAGKDRGYYFNGYSSYLNIDEGVDNSHQLVLSPKFAIGFWVYPIDSGVIFAKQSESTLGLLIEILDSLYVQVSIILYQADSPLICSSSITVALKDWNYIGVTVSLGDDLSAIVTILVNKILSSPIYSGSTYYNDFQSSFTAVLGAKYNETLVLDDYFTGYIQSMTVWNTDQSLTGEVSSSCTGGCTICPITGTCLTDCGVEYYYSSSCTNCKSACTEGCVRGEDCNLCYDRLCEFCGDYTSSGCTKCVDGASFVSGVCQCTSGTSMSRSNGNLYCATTCMAYCATCYSSTNGGCLSCNDGYFLDNNNLCVPECQTGYIGSNKKCSAHSPTSKILHYIFDTTINNPQDKTDKLLAYMGSTTSYAGNYDINDPIPLYKRGIYFNGNKKYTQLPVNDVESRGVIMGNTHSIKLWLKPLTTSSTGCLLVKELSSMKYFYLSLDSSLVPTVYYKLLSSNDASSSSISVTGKTLQVSIWQELVVVFERSGRSSTATIYVNGVPGKTNLVVKTFFSELKTYKFKLGYSETDLTSFKGYIYELIIFNYAINPIAPDSTSCDCDACTSDGACLSDCDSLEYIDENSLCESCLPECTNGCLNGDNCEGNEDPLCGEYTSFAASTCTKCKNLAVFISSKCQCGDHTIAYPTYCECVSGYEGVDGFCLPCYYHIQTVDIDSYFSEDFLSLEFDFAFELQSSTSATCSVLFSSDTLTLFGTGYSCKWSSDKKKLTVKLGDDPEVYDDSVIIFNRNTLLTKIESCGSNRGPISTVIYFKYDIPEIIPEADITAPFEYYIYCGNLSMSGSYSVGGYGRKLKYLWDFDSSPNLTVLTEADLTQVYLEYNNNTLSPSTVNASLTVTNWLGFNNTAWQIIEVNPGVGLDLGLDKNIKWKMTSQTSKSIYVQANSECKISDNLTYFWTIDSYTGENAYVDEQLLWSSQKTPSKLYIPKGALGPGIYIFQLRIYDNDLDLEGKTKLKMTIYYSELEINFNPPYRTVDLNQDFILDGSVADDPDKLPGTIEYEWSCYSSDNCTDLISNTKAKQPKVLKGTLQEGLVYDFTLTVTKGVRTTTNTLSLLPNTNTSLIASFDKKPIYINNQENFVLRPELSKNCNCTYEWKFVSGGDIVINTDIRGKDLGIEPYSMDEGVLYVMELVVDDESENVSIFREYFTVDIPPVGGTLYANTYYGTEKTTVFKLTAPNWYDPKDSSLPLTYQFGYYLDTNTYYVNMKNESYIYYTTLPASDPLDVFVRVYDIYGVYTEISIELHIQTTTLDITKLIQDTNYLLDLSWTDPDILPGQITALALYISENTDNMTYIYDAFKTSIYAIEILRDSLQDIDFSKIDVLLNMINITTIYPVDSSNKTTLFQLLNSITQIISDDEVIMSAERAQSYVEVITNISPFDAGTVFDSPQELNQANEVLKALALASSETMGQTQSITYGSGPIKAHFKLYKGDDIWSFTSPESFNQTFINLPICQNLSFVSSMTILSILTTYNAEQNLYNTTDEYSSAVEFSLVQIFNDTQIYINTDLEPDTINITVPVWNLDKKPKCGYWDSVKWSTKGCKLDRLDGNYSHCKCTHMSLYTSGSHISEGSDDSNDMPIIIFIVCLLAFLWVFLACCLIFKDRKENESKVFVEKVLAGMPIIGAKKQPRFMNNEVADQLGRTWKVEDRPENRKDSQYVPAAKIGVIGAYFDEKVDPSGELKDEGKSLKKAQEYKSGPKFEGISQPGDVNIHEGSRQGLNLPGYETGSRLGAILPFTDDIHPKGSGQNPKNPGYQSGPMHQGVQGPPEDSMGGTGKPGQKGLEYQSGARFGGIQNPEIHDLDTSEKNIGNPKSDYRQMDRFEGAKGFEDKNDPGTGDGKGHGGGNYNAPERFGGIKNFDGPQSNERHQEGQAKGPNYQSAPKLGGIIPLDPDDPGSTSGFQGKPSQPYHSGSKFEGIEQIDLESQSNPSGYKGKGPNPYQSGPRLGGIQQLDPDHSGSSIGPHGKGINPYQPGPRFEGIQQIDPNYSANYPEHHGKDQQTYHSGPRLGGIVPLDNPSAKNAALPTGPSGKIPYNSPSHMEGVQGLPADSGRVGSSSTVGSKNEYVSPSKFQGISLAENQGGYSMPPDVKIAELGDRGAKVILKSTDSGDFQKKKFAGNSDAPYSSESSKTTAQGMRVGTMEIDPNEVGEINTKTQHPRGHEGKEKNIPAGTVMEQTGYRKKFDDHIKVEDFSIHNSKNLEDDQEHHEDKNVSEKSRLIPTGERNIGESRPSLENKSRLQKPIEEEKIAENTELFTQPDSPKGRMQFRRKKHDDQEIPNIEERQELRYVAWIANYFFSAIMLYHENYTRFSRCCQGVCSFLLQAIFIGLIISGLGSSYGEDKGNTIDSQVSNLIFQDIAIAFSMVIVTNLIVGAMLCLFFRRTKVQQYYSDGDKLRIDKNNKLRERIGIAFVLMIIIGTIIGVGFLEMSMLSTGSMLWVICLFIAFIFDFFVVQILKMVIYNYFWPGLILPVS